MNRTQICNYAEYATVYSHVRVVENVIGKIEQNVDYLTTWFPEDHMKLSEDNGHFIIFETSKEKVHMNVEEVQIQENDDRKLLGRTLDKIFSFKKHVETLCKEC